MASKKGLRIRKVGSADEKKIIGIIKKIPEFSKGDVQTCIECLRAYFEGDENYYFDCAEENGIAGFVCYGWDTIAQGVLEIYWIAVAAEHRRKGIAKFLESNTESIGRKMGGRVVFVETESDPRYAGTRGFYESCGYTEAARVKDFYRLGNDKIIYRKDL